MGKKAEILKVRLCDYLASFPRTKVFFNEKHAVADTFFSSDITHSIATSEDYQVCPDISKFANFIIDKIRYSAFYDTQLDGFLRQRRVHEIGLLGMETQTSVLFTAEELRNRGFEVSVIEPCTMSRDDVLHGFAISVMRHYLGVRIVNG